MNEQLFLTILFEWVVPMAIMLGLYMSLVNFLYTRYEKLDIDRIWGRIVKIGIATGILVGIWLVVTNSEWFQNLVGITKQGANWISNTDQAQTAMGYGNTWWQRVLQFFMRWIPIYFRAFILVGVSCTAVYIQSLIWRIQFTRAINIFLSLIGLFPFLACKYFFGYQTPFFDFLQSRLFIAKLKENVNDSYFDALQGFDENGEKFRSGAGGTPQKQRIKAATVAIRRTKSHVKTAGGMRKAELITKNSRETETDRLIENVLKGFGQRITASNIRFQNEPVLNISRGGYVFDSEVPFKSGDKLGDWQSIFTNPFSEENKVNYRGDGAVKTYLNVLLSMFEYIMHFTPPAIYDRIMSRTRRLYTPDRSGKKANFKAQQNIDLDVIPTPVDTETGNDIDTQKKNAKRVAMDRVDDVSNALNAYNLSGTFQRVLVGGNTAIYQYALPPDATLTQDFDKIQKGIANILKTNDIPVMTLSAGVLSVSMVNGVNIPVDMRQMIKNRSKGMKTIITAIPGVDALGKNITIELGDTAPHMILFGATGFGKTVTIMSILYTTMSAVDPSMLKIAYIDGKGNSFEFMRTDNTDSPNYHPNPFTYAQPADASGDIDYARALMKHIEGETRRRIDLFKKKGVSKLSEFNKKFPDEALYEMLVVIDEFSAILDQDDNLKASEKAEKGTLDTIVYLAKMARSVGIRLLLANQTARKIQVPGEVTANINARLSLSVTEPMESQMALPDSEVPVHLINQAGEFYSNFNGIRNPDHGNSPNLSDDTMNDINDSLERNLGHHDYVVTREDVMAELYGEEAEETSYAIPDPMPTQDTPLEDLLNIIERYPDWAQANEQSLVFKRNKEVNADDPKVRKENKKALKEALENCKGKEEMVGVL